MEGYLPENDVDHINENKNDNRWYNLREVSRQCNSRNTGNRLNNKSGIKGVCFSDKTKKWYSYIHINGKKKHLGVHLSIEDAAASRYNAEIKYNFLDCSVNSPAYNYLRYKNII